MLDAPVRIEIHGSVTLLLVDNPPVNATSLAVRRELLAAIETAEQDAAIDALVIACAGKTFIAGADVREMDKITADPILPQVVQRIEDCTKPVVAAIHGTALGGGCEIALACHGRLMAPESSMGLPEVKLGLIPGSGGTQRLPRLVGLVAALDIITSGRRVTAAEALSLGLADRIAGTDLQADAIALARSLAGAPLRRLSQLPVPAADAASVEAAIAAIKKKARGQSAPVVAAEIIRLAAELPFAAALARERAAFLDLIASDQSKALRHAFAAERAVTRVPHLEGVVPHAVESVGIIGAGTMGAGIAVAFADAGFPVTVVETSAEAAEAGRGRVASLWDRQVKSGRITQDERDDKLARVRVVQDYAELSDADLIVEAAFEDMAVKHAIFAKLAAIAKPGAVLASNTSYLDINAIAAGHARPADTIGLHFFSPANVMRLVEVVEPQAASKEAVATGVAVAKKLGKIPVVCKVCDGFVGNRILASWRAIVELMLEDGAFPEEIDAALEAYGMAMGPFAVSDLAGLDIALARRKRLAATRDPAARYPSAIADRLCEAGRFGQKTGAGWYAYKDGKRAVDPFVTQLIEEVAAEKGIKRRPFPAETIQRYVRAAMVNEGARILEEGIVPRALDIDVVLMTGYGFPSWRGGPMFEADQIGLAAILSDMRDVFGFVGKGYEPAPLLEALAARGKGFADLPLEADA